MQHFFYWILTMGFIGISAAAAMFGWDILLDAQHFRPEHCRVGTYGRQKLLGYSIGSGYVVVGFLCGFISLVRIFFA